MKHGMNNMRRPIIINPDFPIYESFSLIIFVPSAIALAITPYLDIISKVGLIFLMLLLILLSLYLLIYGRLKITITNNGYSFRGYLSIVNYSINKNEIKGYRVDNIINSIEGYHTKISIVLNDNRTIHFPKFYYSNTAYEDLCLHFFQNFECIGESDIKNGKLQGTIIRLIFAIGGILSLIVALKKLL